jgi:geranylgeranyl reductase family protein
MDQGTPDTGRYDLAVIGAGPSGSYAALRLSSMGYKTILIDRKWSIGRPVQCAGLVNSKTFSLPKIAEIGESTILKSIKGADIFSPSGTMLPIMASEPKAHSIDRHEFDRNLLISAIGNGCEFLPGHVLKNLNIGNGDSIEITVKGPKGVSRIRSRMLIGSDGPTSTTRHLIGLPNPLELIPGISMELEIQEGKVQEDKVAVLTGQKTAKGFFSWIIPSFGNHGVRIGLSSIDGSSLRNGIKNLFKDRRISRFLGIEGDLVCNHGVISRVYGSVPMGQPKRYHKGPVLLIGDSAAMAKATSGGGIYPALLAVNDLCGNLENGRAPGNDAIRGFIQTWKKGYGRELQKTMSLRRILRDLKDTEMDKGLNALDDEKKLEIINGKGDIDHPVQLAVSLLKQDPKLLYLIPRFVPHLRRLFI